MQGTRGLRVACLALGLALLGASCTGPQQDAGRNGARGGTLLVLSAESLTGLSGLDTAGYAPMARAYARTLYGYNLAGPPDQVSVPVPDIASGPPQLSADRRTYTFTLRPGVRYAPPVNREVTARDFITAIQRLYDKTTPSYWRQYADLIAGAAAFGAGKASRISGLAAPDARTLQITLDQPAGDFLSILTQPFFAPVPGEYAASYAVGANYDGHVVGSGPYMLDAYIPGRLIVFVRNPNWDAADDPLRKAWVDRIQVKLNVSIPSIQRAIDREEADLSLDSHVPATQLAVLRADPERSRRLSVNPTGESAVPSPWDPPGGRGDRRRPGPPGGQLRHRQDRLPRRHRRELRPQRRTGLHHPGPGVARLPPLRPLPVAGGGATRPKPRHCWPRLATPTG